MQTGKILRIGIYLLGIYAILTSLTHGAYFVMSYISTYDANAGIFFQTMTSRLLAYFVFPLGFAFWSFGFADRTVRFLLGRDIPDEALSTPLSSRTLFVVGAQLIGLYFLIESGAGCISHLFESFAHRVRDTHPVDPRFAAELVKNIAGLIGGALLCFKASVIEVKTRQPS